MQLHLPYFFNDEFLTVVLLVELVDSFKTPLVTVVVSLPLGLLFCCWVLSLKVVRFD
jgi:hypothetical protein